MYSRLEDELGREPSDAELAKEMDLDLDSVRDMLKKTSIVSLVSLDDFLEQNHEQDTSSRFGAELETPETEYEKRELRESLAAAIDRLSEKEKQVITLYYYEELTLKEISAIMGVSESRISQIHSKAVVKLRGKLKNAQAVAF